MALRLVFLAVFAYNLLICRTLESAGEAQKSYPELLGAFNTKEREEPMRQREDVPTFLLNLYRKRSHLSRGRLKDRKSETVRIFFREPFEEGEFRGPLHRRFFFNLSAITTEEKITKAELRVFKKIPKTNNSQGYFRIRVIRLIQQRTRNSGWKENGILVASHLVKSRENSSRWLSFDVTSAVKFWKKRPSENFGLSLAVDGLKAFPSDFHIGGRGRRVSFLVTYTVKSSPETSKEPCDNEAREHNEGDSLRNASTTAQNRVKRSDPNRCQRRWFFVKFRKLKWNWIIAPRGYSANYCEGFCPRILDMHLEPTNHAILQNILHRMDKRIPSPSCVPTKLHAISVLYRASDKSIALTEYTGMVVSTCGCR